MTESTVGWFGVREKYCSLADKPWLISQIRASDQAAELKLSDSDVSVTLKLKYQCRCSSLLE